jgi:hypothetical protein
MRQEAWSTIACERTLVHLSSPSLSSPLLFLCSLLLPLRVPARCTACPCLARSLCQVVAWLRKISLVLLSVVCVSCCMCVSLSPVPIFCARLYITWATTRGMAERLLSPLPLNQHTRFFVLSHCAWRMRCSVSQWEQQPLHQQQSPNENCHSTRTQ